MLHTGDTILEGRYTILKKYGSGSFGDIYIGKSALLNKPNSTLVEESLTGEVFAAKVVSQSQIFGIEQAARRESDSLFYRTLKQIRNNKA